MRASSPSTSFLPAHSLTISLSMDTMNYILERLNQVFQYVFEDDEICITRATTAEDVQDWDSVKHVTLMVTVEKTFGIIFTSSQVAGLKNVGELVDLVEAKLKRLTRNGSRTSLDPGVAPELTEKGLMQSTAVPLDGGNLFRVVRGMEKQGRIHEALALLREARRNTLDTEGIQRAGRTIHNAWLAGAFDGSIFGSSYSGNSRRLG